jgi:outer membrane protein TolC
MYNATLLIIAGCLACTMQAQDKTDSTTVLLTKNDSLFYYDQELNDKFYVFRKLDAERDLDDQLLPVNEIIEIAIRNHPQVKEQEETRKALEYQAEQARRQWQQNIVGNASYFQGTQYQVSTIPNDNTQTAIFGNGLRYGVSVNVPLFEFSGRKSRIRAFQHQAAASTYRKEEIELELSRQVIFEYTRLVTAQRMLKIEARGRDQTAMHLSNAELEFKSGDISISEYARISDVAKKAELDFEIARRDFFTAYYQFEQLVGEKMENLTVRRK